MISSAYPKYALVMHLMLFVPCAAVGSEAPNKVANPDSFVSSAARSKNPEVIAGNSAEPAAGASLAPWQRELMLGLMKRPSSRSAAPASSANSPSMLTSADGAWSPLLLTARAGHTAIYDPVRDRMIVFGGLDGNARVNEVWALSLGGSPEWTPLTPTGTPPAPRYVQSGIYDPVRDRLIIFGGDGEFGIYLKDVWALSLSGDPTWTDISPAGGPPAGLHGSSAVYDPLRDRMLVFGGLTSSSPFYPTDMWALSLSGTPTWSMLAPTGTLPSGRYGHTAIYDPVRDRMIIFGGWDGASNLNDTWALSLSGTPAWDVVSPMGGVPLGRREHAAIYDTARDRMVIFSGWDEAHPSLNDAWALSLSATPTWTNLAPAGTPPSMRYRSSAIYDPVRDRMIAFAGGEVFGEQQNDAWALSFSGAPQWTPLTPTSRPPTSRNGASGIYDPLGDRLIVFGGENSGDTFFNDVWALSLSGIPTWSALAPTGSPPSRRRYQTGIYDPVRDRMIIFSGADEGSLLDDVWELSLSGLPTWTRLTPTGSLPLNRYGSQAIYDPVRDRMLVFGGFGDGGFYNDVWALSLSGSPAWSELAPLGTPPPGREFHGLVYDPVGDRLITVAGDASGIRNDVWALSLSGEPAWTELTPSGTPPSPRSGLTTVYDPTLARVIVFGGRTTDTDLNDVWALSLSGSPSWQPLAPFGMAPSGRYRHTGIYDPIRNRMIVYSGDDGLDRHDAWALSWGGTTATLLSLFEARQTSEGVEVRWQFGVAGRLIGAQLERSESGTGPWSEVNGDRRVEGETTILLDHSIEAGRTYYYRLVAALEEGGVVTFGPVSVIGGPALGVFALGPVAPSPSRGTVQVEFDVPRQAAVRLSVLDVQGRLVAVLAQGVHQPGRYLKTWKGTGDGGRMPPGMYFVRYTAPGTSSVRRVVLAR